MKESNTLSTKQTPNNMTDKLASIEVISEISSHSNADALEFVHVLGYKCIVPKGKFHVGNFVVFIAPDTILPDDAWAAGFKKYAQTRVRAVKIRGEYSFGIVVDPGETPLNPGLYEGKDVSEELNIQKYEAPTPQELNAQGNLPFGIFKTDENRYNGLRYLPYGELVDVTLKRDGSSATYYCKKLPDGDYQTGICSRSLELKKDCQNNFTLVNDKLKILEKLEIFCRANDKSLALRGEVFGAGIQGYKVNPDKGKPVSWECFSVLDLDTLKYHRKGSDLYFKPLCEALDLPHVPIVEEGVELTRELIQKYVKDIEKINGQMFEGVVINSSNMSFKAISMAYDAAK